MAAELGALWFFAEEWRFDEIPPDVVHDAYMKSLLICANGDGNLTEAERNWVIGYHLALGGSEALTEGFRTYQMDEDLNEVKSRSAAVAGKALIFDAIRACAADGVLVEDERDGIRRMAGKLGVSKEAVGELEALYAEEQRLKDRRLQLIFPEGTPY